MPKEILRVAKKYMGDYQLISVKNEQMTTTQTSQIYFEVNEKDKLNALCRIIDVEPDFYGIIFCKTKLDVDYVVRRLIEKATKPKGFTEMSFKNKEKPSSLSLKTKLPKSSLLLMLQPEESISTTSLM